MHGVTLSGSYMTECSHYREEQGPVVGHEATANRHPGNYALTVAYCNHPTDSPWGRTMAMLKPEGYLSLKCGGRFIDCPLSEEQRMRLVNYLDIT